MASKVNSAAGSVERFFLPRLNSIDGELKALNTRVDSCNTRIESVGKSIDSLRNELKAEIRAVASAQGAKIDSVLVKVEQIGEQLDIDRRLTIIEAKMKEFEKRS